MDELHHESKHKSHRLISPLLPPLGWPKIFFSSSLLSFIFNQIRYKYCKQCRTHDSTEPRRKGNAKLQILVFGHATYSFEFVTFRRFFYIFSRYFSSNLPVLFKNLPLTGSCYCIPSCDRNHTFAHRNTPPPRRGGGPEGRRGFTPTRHPHGKQKMKNRTAIMAAPLRGSSPCKAGQFISTTFPLSVSMKFRTISN